MEALMVETAITQGIWATLFVGLLFWVLKQNAKREENYQGIINKITDKFENLENGIEYLKNKIDRWGEK